MDSYSVGQIVPALATGRDSIVFDVSPSGGILRICFNGVSADDIAQVSSASPAEFRLFEYGGIMFVLVKLGSLEWMDAPYHPMWSLEKIETLPLELGTGLGVTIMLIDSRNGEIKHIRLIGWNTRITTSLWGYMDLSRKRDTQISLIVTSAIA